MKAVSKNGSYKAVAEPASINYYAWIYNSEVILWTLNTGYSAVSEYVYSSPNPQGKTEDLVMDYYPNIDAIIVNGYPCTRHATSDTTYTGTSYKLINQ